MMGLKLRMEMWLARLKMTIERHLRTVSKEI